MLIFKKMCDINTEAAGKTGKKPIKTALFFSCLKDVMYDDISILHLPFFRKGNRKVHNLDASI